MAAVFLNDIGSNPWILAEKGVVTAKSVKAYSFTYHEPDETDHVAELSDVHGRLVARLDSTIRSQRCNGWVHGLTVDRLDSGYVLVSLTDKG